MQESVSIFYIPTAGNHYLRNLNNIYSTEFIADKNLVIKAFAHLDGFYDSDIETYRFSLRDFVIQDVFPAENQTVHKFAIPYITFNQPFHLSSNSEGISFKDNIGNEIPYTLHIGDNQLFICPKQHLNELTGYNIIIPDDAICSDRDESNNEITVNFNTGSKVVGISFGTENAAIIKSDGSLWVWGQSRYGQLGTGDGSSHIVESPIRIMDNVVDVQLSYMQGLALKSDGTVWSWGRNDSGYLGCGNKQNQLIPIQILNGVSKIYCGERTSAAITYKGSLYMWGSNYYGQIGDGSNSTALSPKKILSNVTDVAVRCYHTAAIVDGSSIYAWGHNCHKEIFTYGTYGQSVEVKKPWRLGGFSGSAVATTEGNTIFLNNGTVNICGINFNGIFGNGFNDSYVAQGMIKPISNIKEIKSALYYILALDNNNTLWGWGKNDYGQIGAGYYSDVTKPYKILDDVVFFSAGYRNGAAILSNGDVYAWGNNAENQLLGKCSSSKTAIPTKIIDGPSEHAIESIRLICAKNTIAPNMNTVFVPIVSPNDASISSISWSTSDANVATVNEFGVVTGVSDGVANITATIESKDGNIWNTSSEIIVDINASVNEISHDNGITIYSKDRTIFVELSTEASNIKVFDIYGRFIVGDYNCNSSAFHDMDSGVYIVQIDNYTKKIIVI